MYKIGLWFKEASVGLFRNFWWNSIALVLSIVCLTAFAISFAAGNNAEHFSDMLNEKVEIQLNVKEGQTNYNEIQQDLALDERINEISFVSKDEAYEKMTSEMGEDYTVLEIFDENPLPAQFIVKVNNPDDLDAVAKSVEGKEYTDKVLYGKEYIQRLLEITTMSKKIGLGVTILGAIFVVFLVTVAIRMNIQQRKEEVRIKHLVGSGMLTTRMPFVLEALMLMAIGSIASYYLFAFLYKELEVFVAAKIPYLQILSSSSMTETLFQPLFGLALFMGLFGSIIASNRHLSKE